MVISSAVLIAVDCKKEAGFMQAKWLEKWTCIITGKCVIFIGRSTWFKDYKVLVSSWARPLWPSLEILLWVPWEKAPSVLDWKVILLSSNEWKLNGWIFDIVVSFWKEKGMFTCRRKYMKASIQCFLALTVTVKQCEATVKTCFVFNSAVLLFSNANLLLYLKTVMFFLFNLSHLMQVQIAQYTFHVKNKECFEIFKLFFFLQKTMFASKRLHFM